MPTQFNVIRQLSDLFSDRARTTVRDFPENYRQGNTIFPSPEEEASARLAFQGSVMGDPRPAIQKGMNIFGAGVLGKAGAARFADLAEAQRGAPESAMIKLQTVNGGGVLNYVAEHGGDVVHRQNEFFKWPIAYAKKHGTTPSIGEYKKAIEEGRQYVLEKTDKVLKVLRSKYGFAREHAENLKSNAKYRKVDLQKHESAVKEAMKQYAEEHAKLPHYNRPQLLANKAAISVGKGDWTAATRYYQQLHDLAKSPATYENAMMIDIGSR